MCFIGLGLSIEAIDFLVTRLTQALLHFKSPMAQVSTNIGLNTH